MKRIVLDGKSFVVSDEWFEVVVRPYNRNVFKSAEIEALRQKLMVVSNVRPLSRKERGLLENVTHISNVINAIRVVGAHHDPVKEWGFDGWDAVHGNAHHQECGCVKRTVFDHHSATNHFGHNRVSAERKHHEIEPLRVCETHKAG